MSSAGPDSALQAELRRIAGETGRSYEALSAEAKRAGAELGSRRGALGTRLFTALSRFVRRRGYPRPPIHDLGELERVRQCVRDGGAVFLVTHKTYLDFFVLFEFFRDHGMPAPRIFGGANMAFAGFGSLARQAGGIFIRRSFRDDPVYKAVLRHRLGDLLAQRENFMWAIEGTRSRTGKLLAPRLGLLHYVTEAARPLGEKAVSFVPVSVVYDRIPDVADMAAQEAGAAKQRESVAWFLRYLRSLGGDFGDIHVRFGATMSPGDTPDAPDLQASAFLSPTEGIEVQKLAFEACYRINEITPATTTSLVLLSLLCRGRCTLERVEADVRDLEAHIAERHPHAHEQRPSRTAADNPGESAMALAASGVIEVGESGSGKEFSIRPQSISVAIYYSNMAAHHFVISAFAELVLTLLVQRGEALDRQRFEAGCFALRELFKFEFFFSRRAVFIQQMREELDRLGLREANEPHDPETVADCLAGKKMRVAAGVLSPYLNAYRAVVDRLENDPVSRAASDPQLISACLQAAQRAPGPAPGISRALLANGLRVADSRGLRAGPEDATAGERRRAFLDELGRLESALQRLTGMNAARQQP